MSDIPKLGYGTWQRRGQECVDRVRDALEIGYRHIDTARMYDNETEVGTGVRTSGVPREEVFVTTKVWYDSLGIGEVRSSAEGSLRRLGLEYVDLLLIHWPSPGDRIPVAQYVSELAEVKAAGLARHIGVSNFNCRQVDEAVAAVGADQIATNQVELNVFFPNRLVADHCHGLGIPMTAYIPLAKGNVGNDNVLSNIAASKGLTPSQIALAFLLNEGHIAIPSSSRRERLVENFAAGQIRLNEFEMDQLRKLGTGSRRVNPEWAPDWD